MSFVCKQCGNKHPESFRSSAAGGSSRVCRKCHYARSKAANECNPFRVKSSNVITNHAASTGLTRKYLRDVLRWDREQIEKEFEIAFNHCQCPCGCKRMFGDMDKREMTVDVIDPSAPPLWGVNTRIVCSNHNKQKRDRTMAELVEYCINYTKYDQVVEPAQLPLFG